MTALRLWRKKKYFLGIVILLLGGVAFMYFFLNDHRHTASHQEPFPPLSHELNQQEDVEKTMNEEKEISKLKVNYNVLAFYYTWYGNKKFNGKYIHWNHPRLEHWNKLIGRSFSTEIHEPPEDIGANYYPQIGLYSFMDSTVIEAHFKQMKTAGIGVIVLSWYPPHMADDQGVPTHYIVPRLLHFAAKHGLKLALHIEPYARRDVVNLRRHIRMLGVQNITNHAAYLRWDSKPVLFVYDSYRTDFTKWSRLLLKTGDLTIRGTPLDSYVVGLYFREGDCRRFGDTGFNGAYSYFGIDGFSAGSRISEWTAITGECRRRGIEFIPCVSPGYDDTAVRPWNADNKRERLDGKYYRQMFDAAINSGASSIAITSFNEWHEGTQIEPAKPFENPKRTYSSYLPNPPDFYLHLTRALVDKFTATRPKPNTS